MKISVCIPAYNQVHLFERCLQSIIKQSFKDYEIVVSDDSETNVIEQLLLKYKLPQLIYHRNKTPLGSPANWNNAIRLASGQYIKILHHDDYFTHEDSLKLFADAAAAHPSINFFFCQSLINFEVDKSVFIHKQTQTQLKRLRSQPAFLFYRNVIGAPSATLFKKDNTIIFNPEYIWLVDVEFYINYLKCHQHFMAIHKALVTIAHGQDTQITSQVSKNAGLVIKENLELFAALNFKVGAKKSGLVYFGELLNSFGIKTYAQLCQTINVPPHSVQFINEVFEELKKAVLIKKIKKRFLTSRYNKKFLKIERF